MSRRADRLFRLVAELRGRRLAVTAAELGRALEVSPRTIYRDIADLIASGVPIDGEAGVGYRLDPGFDLPPVQLTRDEALALLVGGRMVEAFTDDELGAAAARAASKIRAILDEPTQARLDRQPYRVPKLGSGAELRARHLVIRRATEARHKLALDYSDETGAPSRRVIWPLGLVQWPGRWVLLAWCELRDDFRSFRFDRIAGMDTLDEIFPDRADRSLAAYLRRLDPSER